MNKKIGIVGGFGEMHTMHMKAMLEHFGAETLIIDTLNYPQKVHFSLRNGVPIYNGSCVDDVTAFYNRTVFYSEPIYDHHKRVEAGEMKHVGGWYDVYTAERERQSFLGSWMRAVAYHTPLIVNPVHCFHLHFLKPHQIVMLRRAGVPVPETLVTNSPAEVMRFRNEMGDVVYKPVAGGASCRLLTDEDLQPERLESLSKAPVIFQRLYRGADVRVFVLGGEIMCALEIETDEIDYRGNESAVRVIDLPEDVSRMCLKAAELCSMVFTGIDVKRTSNNEYVVLECNPSPMFIGFQTRSGFPIDQHLALYLIGRAAAN